MSRIRKYAIACGTFSIAMAIGFVMQNGDALASRMINEETVAEGPDSPMQFPQQASVAVTIPNLPAIQDDAIDAAIAPQLVPVPEPDAPTIELAAAESITESIDAGSDVMTDATESGQVCVPDLVASPATAAMVSLVLDAPCSPNALATIHHQGMIFSTLTDASGMAILDVPALAANAVFIAELPGGSGAAAIVTVPDLADYDRAVLQWQGETGLQLHALEFGASYNSDGHVWAASSRSADAVFEGQGGFLTKLGAEGVDNALFAEVYTFPSGMMDGAGEVALSVEAEILANTCGREIAAQSIQIRPGEPPYALDLTMTLPGCDAVGEFLVLKNMLESLTLASR